MRLPFARPHVVSLIALVAACGGCSLKVAPTQQVASGDFPCDHSAECPASSEPCLLSLCDRGQCVFVPAPEGRLPPSDQLPGDCRLRYCDASGMVVEQSAPADFPAEDDNACTEAACDVNVAIQRPLPMGQRCGEGGVCNGAGRCGVCMPAARRCKDAGVSTCGSEGAWAAVSPCGDGELLCHEGRCLGVTDVALGAAHGCARLEDGSLACWGANERGQLGHPDASFTTGSIATFSGTAAQLAMGRSHACAGDMGGAVSCWGANEHGQLGDGSFDASRRPVLANMVAEQLAVGDSFSCARRADGTVVCWGRGARGQLGHGKKLATVALPTPDAVVPGPSRAQPARLTFLRDVVALALSGRTTCVQSNALAGWRCFGGSDFALPAARSGVAVAAATPPAPSVVSGLSEVVELACGAAHCCARRRSGEVLCWGANERGQLGRLPHRDSASAAPVVEVAGARRIALGRDFSCALVQDGKVLCWGANERAQLGVKASPAGPVRPVALPGPAQVLVAGDDFACALGADKTLRCWGDNRRRQLGRSDPDEAGRPMPLRHRSDQPLRPRP